jgi:hypothetical protein
MMDRSNSTRYCFNEPTDEFRDAHRLDKDGPQMQLALWIASGLLAFAMLSAGAAKLVTPRVKLMEKMKWAKTWNDGNVKLLGLAEVVGAVGLVVPQVTGILPILTPIAAACLVVLMIGAVKTHLDLKEPAAAPGLLALLALFVALGRAGVLS